MAIDLNRMVLPHQSLLAHRAIEAAVHVHTRRCSMCSALLLRVATMKLESLKAFKGGRHIIVGAVCEAPLLCNKGLGDDIDAHKAIRIVMR